MVKKVLSHVHENTPHKDRLTLTVLVAIFAFTVVNTVLQFTQLALDDAAFHIMY